MRIILLGAPGAGKGTQAQFIVEKYSIPKISTGDMFRTIIQTNSKLGRKAKQIMEAGKLVPDELTIALVKQRIRQDDCRDSFLLDGFPRTISQAASIIEAGINIDYVLEFYVPDQVIIDRIVGRRIHESSGRIYHIKFKPPKIENKDDITGEPLTLRKDDQLSIVRQRLIEYHQQIEKLLSYYRQQSDIGSLNYFKLDGTQKISKIREELIRILG